MPIITVDKFASIKNIIQESPEFPFVLSAAASSAPAHIKDGASRAVIISRLTLNEVYHNTLPVTMSLWRPYSDDADVPMDLTQPQVQGVKFPDHHPPQCSECYPSQLPVPPGYYGAPLQIFPGGSTSGYVAAPYRQSSPPESSIEVLDPLSDDPEFQDFEESALSVIETKNGGALVGSNPRMRAVCPAPAPMPRTVAIGKGTTWPPREVATVASCKRSTCLLKLPT
ncbi:hypothetical protein PYW08_011480 [Mythimna loreyi]|uniref:Uncharacterized protein n=1 Tax=Mythimna loreyi TaxID=667449 RepID=A0ACC2QLH0_9NEOP|nr:hypothetical protein PYW08_011480 [Mythimna loreyi]